MNIVVIFDDVDFADDDDNTELAMGLIGPSDDYDDDAVRVMG